MRENRNTVNRRGFFLTLTAGLAAVADPERLLWVPGRKLISIPKPQPWWELDGFPSMMPPSYYVDWKMMAVKLWPEPRGINVAALEALALAEIRQFDHEINSRPRHYETPHDIISRVLRVHGEPYRFERCFVERGLRDVAAGAKLNGEAGTEKNEPDIAPRYFYRGKIGVRRLAPPA
jgi:hypothetical protein